jgi:hypothetical protein
MYVFPKEFKNIRFPFDYVVLNAIMFSTRALLRSATALLIYDLAHCRKQDPPRFL